MANEINDFFQSKRKMLDGLKDMRTQKLAGGEVKKKEELIVCPACKNEYGRKYLKKELYVCPNCNYHMMITGKRRIKILCDKGSFVEQNKDMVTKDPLSFPGYPEKLEAAREKTDMKDALIAGSCTIDGHPCELVVLDPNFFMGSMGTIVGEKFTLAVEYAAEHDLPFVAVAASGGARMQEGLYSLMQMAKTSAAIEKFKSEGGLYISILTHPTTGGVSASFATLGDITIAEPKALIGFAGPRVIEQTIGAKLPKGFQRAEFLMEHGFLDMIVERKDLKETVGRLLMLHSKNHKLD